MDSSNHKAGLNLSEEQSFESMRLVFEHYLDHHKAVFKKLHHARRATHKSYEELTLLAGNLRKEKKPPEALSQAHAYDVMWGNILDIFKDYDASENELDAIDTILTEIPRQIKKHYDLFIEQDKILKQLIAKLHTPEYKKALSLIEDVQNHPAIPAKTDYQYAQEATPVAYRYDRPTAV